jgi:hypothetical protein
MAHTAKRSMTFLMEIFPGRLVTLFSDSPWPVRCPYLTVPYFFLWESLKSKVYDTRLLSNQEMIDRITEGI